ncbi:MAG: hypothetical protein VXX87_05475, partial [Pseudomonadota bacterium]|nr:hypothetical protein [Pseudomonadota bacterium]
AHFNGPAARGAAGRISDFYMKMGVGGPKPAKRPRPERATYLLTLNTLRFECRSTKDLPYAKGAAH